MTPSSPRRVFIDRVEPRIDGRFVIKRVVGEGIRLLADIYSDGRDLLVGIELVKQADRRLATTCKKELALVVACEIARSCARHKTFPRSTTAEQDRCGTFKDCEACLPYAAGMGLNVHCFPLTQPAGLSFRQGIYPLEFETEEPYRPMS